MRNPFRCLNSSPEAIRLTVMMYVRFPPSLRPLEELLRDLRVEQLLPVGLQRGEDAGLVRAHEA